MLILRIKSSNNNGVTQLSSSISTLQSLIHVIHPHYSTKSTPNHQINEPHFMVDYLINSLGFSKDQAFSVLTKVRHLKSTEKPNSVVDFFKQCGLDKTQVRNIVYYRPKILTANVDKTLVPKFRVLQELGLPGRGLEKLFMRSSNFSSSRLYANVSYLRKLLDSDEKVLKVVRRSWWMINLNYAQKLFASLLVLEKNGLSNDKIETILLKNPGCLLRSPEWLEATIKKVAPVLGISPQSPRFVNGLEILISLSESTMFMKFEIFRSFGWSDSEILAMTRSLPFCLRGSEAKIQASLKFFMSDLGYSAAYLATHPKLLVYSLEKRVMPRHKVLETLKEKSLLKSNFSLCSVSALSEEKFIKDFVMPYHEHVPQLYETYTKATGHRQTIKRPCVST